MSNSNICTVTFINLQEKKIIKLLAQPKKEKKDIVLYVPYAKVVPLMHRRKMCMKWCIFF